METKHRLKHAGLKSQNRYPQQHKSQYSQNDYSQLINPHRDANIGRNNPGQKVVKQMFELGSDIPISDWVTRKSLISNVYLFIHRMKTCKSFDIDIEIEYDAHKENSKRVNTGNSLVDLL